MIGMQDFETVLAVHRLKSWSEASYSTYQSPSTVSKRIRKVEDQLGSPLFNRAGKNQEVGLTDVGEAALPYIEQMCSLNRRIIAYARDLQTEHVAKLRVGYPPLIGTIGESEVLASFRRDNPDVHLTHLLRHRPELIKLLEDGGLDAAFVFVIGDTAAGRGIWENAGGIELEFVTTMKNNSLCVGVSADHPLAKKKEVLLSELHGETFVFNAIPRHQDTKRTYLRNLLAVSGDDPIPVNIQMMDFTKRDAVLEYIASGYGVLLTACCPPPFADNIRFLKISGAKEVSTGMFVCPKKRQTPALKRLLEAARRYSLRKGYADESQ